MIVQVNHVPRLKYGQWLDIRQAGRVGWGSEEWGINNRTLGVDATVYIPKGKTSDQ